MKKQLIAAGLTAALVLGTAPAAFAAEEADPIKTGGIDKGTMINVKTSVENIDVTVPLALVVTGPVTGGGLTVVPENTSYMIVNNSTKFGVKVETIKGIEQTGWKLVGQPLDPKLDPAGDVGDICLQLKTKDQTAKSQVKTLGTDAVTVNWAIPAHSAEGASEVTGELGIDIVKDKAFGDDTYKGSSIVVKNHLKDTASPAVQIIYTVAIDEGEEQPVE